ncbi:MAG TPA: homoserine kinase [Nitrospiria bacterium]|nr:homoserine kinase [Nitrospiria bacterium]
MNKIKVFVPASVGNVGPGFDTLGMAVTGIGDTIQAMKNSLGQVRIVQISGDGGKLPLSASKNTAGIAATRTLKKMGVKSGIDLWIEKNIPGNGLGSSAASAVAGAVAANLLFGAPLSREELLLIAAEAESFVSGAVFMDNVGASLYGGIILTRPEEKKVLKVGVLKDITVILATPDFPLMTKKARQILPDRVEMGKFISNMSNTCAMVLAVCEKDPGGFGRAISDRIVEPVRASLIPGFHEVKKAALRAGALGCSISGAGPTLFAVAERLSTGEKIGSAMKRAFKRAGHDSVITLSKVDGLGARKIGR